MKMTIIILFFALYSISSYAQWNPTGNNSTTGDLSIGGNVSISGQKSIGAVLNDSFAYNDQRMGQYALRWGEDSSSNVGNGYTLWLSSFRGMKFFTGGKPQFAILYSGNVGIGTVSPTAKLDVNGTIRSKEVKIEATGWSDFVFDKNYQLPTLSEVESHISQHKHLPDIPSQAEVIEQGINVGEMQAKLLQKIEELTLYVIQQDKKIAEQSKRIAELENK